MREDTLTRKTSKSKSLRLTLLKTFDDQEAELLLRELRVLHHACLRSGGRQCQEIAQWGCRTIPCRRA
jgi:hypothetical protein